VRKYFAENNDGESGLCGSRTRSFDRLSYPDPRRFLREAGFLRLMGLPEELAALQRFHGHLGVYVTLGLRMGAIGKRRFGHYKGLTANVRSRLEPPMRCVLDGIQFSSGCTMGKGNIALESGSDPEVTFEKEGHRLRITLRPEWRERIDREMSKEKEIEQSLFYYEVPETEVFEIHEL
jgi:formylmethanofuran dehydrogenase subunit E